MYAKTNVMITQHEIDQSEYVIAKIRIRVLEVNIKYCCKDE